MSVFDALIGQEAAVAELSKRRRKPRPTSPPGAQSQPGAMTHAWLFTGPAGSGRSVAARAFAAAVQCDREPPGCGDCSSCRTVLAGTHPDVRQIVPEGLSIGVERDARGGRHGRPGARRWAAGRSCVIEDADRLTEGASNALLKAIEEPPTAHDLPALRAVHRTPTTSS